VVEFLRSPEKFVSLGARVPKGVLLVGPPGTGKTLLARAVAGEAGVPFISSSGSEFVELYVGVGASRVRSLFQEARRQAPCIVFIDEIDAVGRRRGGSHGISHEEREQTLNQILVEMDGFDPRSNIMLIAATNRADVLDPALLRPGRFDRQVMLDLPDMKGRLEIIRVHSRGKPLEQGVDLRAVARNSAGLSGADLENLLNEAAIMAARRGLAQIGPAELEEALDRVVAGPRRRSRVLSEREKVITAYHETGHALVAAVLPHADEVQKVSIISRGMAGGFTRLIPEQDRNMWSKSEFEAAIASALGGHVAEELIFGEVTTGPSNDLQRATEMARRMVTEFGMSKQIGPLSLGGQPGYEGGDYRGYGDEMGRQVDAEVRQVVAAAHARACRILEAHRDILERTAKLLIEREVLEAGELAELFSEARQRPAADLPVAPALTATTRQESEPRLELARRGRRQRLRAWSDATRPAFALVRRSSVDS
jgi:cell division protease FtsH